MKKKENMPSWAYLGLWGINSRKVLLRYFIGSLILFIVFIILAIILLLIILHSFSIFTLGEIFFFLVCYLLILQAPIMYWFSLKWADNNSAWEESKNS